jgi:hypothetical protein
MNFLKIDYIDNESKPCDTIIHSDPGHRERYQFLHTGFSVLQNHFSVVVC